VILSKYSKALRPNRQKPFKGNRVFNLAFLKKAIVIALIDCISGYKILDVRVTRAH